jgi:hypothetical protein
MKESRALQVVILIFIGGFCFASTADSAGSFGIPELADSVFKQTKTAQQGVFQQQQILNLKPPFYEGSMPLVFVSGKKAITQSEMITVSQDFGKFKTTFSYHDTALTYSGIADGARTNDSSGRLLADAKLIKLLKGEGVHIEEQHYGPDGKVFFRCISFIEFRTGFKKQEMDVKGKKQRDYYFMWPVSPF